jgi:conjugative transfer signal peptidase TraF
LKRKWPLTNRGIFEFLVEEFLVVIFLLVFGLYAVFRLGGIGINLSASVPLGIYGYNRSGMYADFCPEDGGWSAGWGYRPPGGPLGPCPDGAMPLLKRIVAQEGDIVNLSPEGLRVNSILVPHTAPQPRDTAGRIIKPYPYGQYTVQVGEIWVASHEKGGYDSRYFGPVRTSTVTRMRPLITR